jgi:hypothetical protein
MSRDDELIEALDRAAKLLLAKAGGGDKVEVAESLTGSTPMEEPPSLAEQVKAFEAVVDWAKTRRVLAPPEKTETKFGELKRDFHGESPERPGAPPKKVKRAVNGSVAGAGIFGSA